MICSIWRDFSKEAAFLQNCQDTLMQVDVLRDEAEEYARKLEQAGVRVRCKRYKGHFPNSMIKTDVFGKIAEDTYREIAAFVQSST